MTTIKFNVGGRKFETSVDTFKKFPETLLGKITSNTINVPVVKNEKGYIFFDRNSEFFSSILDFYRTGKAICPLGYSYGQYVDELTFWGIQADVKPRFEEIFNQLNYLSYQAFSSNFKERKFLLKMQTYVYTCWMVGIDTITLPCYGEYSIMLILLFTSKKMDVFTHELTKKNVDKKSVVFEKIEFDLEPEQIIRKDDSYTIQCIKIKLW